MASKPAKKADTKNKVKSAPKPARTRSQSPRSQVLPGMEQVRNAKLDSICEEISDGRAVGNSLATAEKKLKQQAAREMEAKSVSAYRQAGVELKFSPGEPTLSVRLIKESTTKKRESPNKETGSGQDAEDISDALTPDDERLAEDEA